MKNKIYTLLLVLLSLTFLFSCEEKFNGPRPGVMITSINSGEDFIEFKLSTSDAQDAAYMILDGEDVILPKAEEIFSKGTIIPAAEATYREDNLKDNSKFTIVVVSRSEEMFSDVKSILMSTSKKAEICTFSISILDKTSSKLKIKVIPSKDEITYVNYIYSKSVIDENGLSNDAKLHEYLMEDLKKLNPSLSVAQICEKILTKGTTDGWLIGLTENTDYVTFAYAMNDKGEMLTSITRKEAKTLEKEHTDLSFELSTANLGPFSVDINVIPSIASEKYVILCVADTEYPDAKTANDIAEAYVRDNESQLDLGLGLLSGNYSIDKYSILPVTNYKLVAFGYNKEITSDATLLEFTSAPMDDIETVTYTARLLELNSNNVTAEIKPSSNNILYFGGLMPTADADDAGVAKFIQTAHENLLSAYEEQKFFDKNLTLIEFLTSTCFKGKKDIAFQGLNFDTNYTLVLFGVDKDANPSNYCFVQKEFADIPERESSDATFTSELFKAFNSTDAKEAGIYPNLTEDQLDLPVVTIKMTANSKAKELFFAVCNDTYTGTDEEVIDKVEWSSFNGIAEFPYKIFMINAWDRDYYIFTVAKDADGVLGQVKRTTINISRDDVSPINELKELLDQAN